MTLEAAAAKVGAGWEVEKADGRTPNPGAACSPKIPGAPPNCPVNLIELPENAGGEVESESDDGVKEKDGCLKGVGEEGGVFEMEFLFKNWD